MEQLLRPIYQERASHPNTLGVIIVEKLQDVSPITDNFDTVLCVLVKEGDLPVYTKHYILEEQKAVMHLITEKQLRKWLLLGSNRKIIDWILNGRVVFDRNEFIHDLKLELRDFPFYGRKMKMGIEFSKLIRRYLEGKVLFDNGNFMDAYRHIVESLHHLARLAVIEQGLHPEVTVWAQVKQIEPAIYKLYDELLLSDEPIDKRLELLFLASEFFIHSRTKDGAAHIIGVLSEKDCWTIQELHVQTELKNYSSNLEVFLDFLVEKEFVGIEKSVTKSEAVFHRLYKVGTKEIE